MTATQGIVPWVAVGALAALLGCSDGNQPNVAGERVIHLWIAPNQAEERFWTFAVDRWNKSRLGTRVEFTTIPATGGSEEAILTALVSGSGPDISANIFPGFAAQLVNLGQLEELSAMPGFNDIIEKRHLGGLLRNTSIAGHHYMMPLYYSPLLIWWRSDILAELGIKSVPRTFEDVYELSRRRAKKDGGLGMQVLAGREWRSRWYDYIAYFYAGSGGTSYIIDRKTQYESRAGLDALDFIQTMFKNRWTGLDLGSLGSDDPLSRGIVAGAVHGAWDISYFQENFPAILKTIVIGPMLRSEAALENGGAKAHTFADCKGIVLFKSSKVNADALKFISWLMFDDEISLLWLKATGMPPSRGDLTSNPIFTEFYRRNPLAREYASYVDVGVPTAPIEETIDVNKIMNVQMIEPMLFESKPAALAAADASRSTNRMLEHTR
jgi:multiple sugar transport system substrate-binding protein